MAQTTLLASGDTRASTAATPVAAGATVTVGIFVTSGRVVPGMRALVFLSTPGAANKEVELDHISKQKQIQGPCTYTVERVEGTFGVYQDA